MSKATSSLKDIWAEEKEKDENQKTSNSEIQKSEIRKSPSKKKTKSKKKESEVSKADYIKVTPTLSPDLYVRLTTLQAQRRIQKKPHSMSDLAREAFAMLLKKEKL